MSPPSWTLVSPPHPSRLSQSTGFGLPASALNPHWLSALHVVICMSQCCFSRFGPPPLPPLCPKCLCLLCRLASRIVSTIILESYVCINIRYLPFTFWLISLCIIGSRFIRLTRTDSNAFLWSVFLFHPFSWVCTDSSLRFNLCFSSDEMMLSTFSGWVSFVIDFTLTAGRAQTGRSRKGSGSA